MKRLFLLLVAAASLTLPSCSLFKMDGPFPAYDELAVIPEDFLYTKYGPLNRWLDTPVRVYFRNLSIREALNQPALRGLKFQLEGKIPHDEKLTMNRIAITRRQLLWSIAQDNQLVMIPIFGEGQEPSYVLVHPK